MPIAVHAYKINPEVEYEVKSIILEMGEYEYDSFRKNGELEPHKIYI